MYTAIMLLSLASGKFLSLCTYVLNMKKTEFMMFGTRQRLARQKCDETDISLNRQSVKHTDTFKYLGVVLDDTLSFNDHVECEDEGIQANQNVYQNKTFNYARSCKSALQSHGTPGSRLL